LKNIFNLLAAALPALLLLPRTDAIFSATMPRKALAEPLLLLLGGWAASRINLWRTPSAYAPSAVALATLLLLFWMIPRSIDLTQIYPSVNALYVTSIAVAGFLLTRCLPLLPGVAKATYGLYLSSMIVAFGLLYASQSALLCSAFTLGDQHDFGWMLVLLGLLAYLLVLVSLTRWLVAAPKSR
jgi:hypothetical protein